MTEEGGGSVESEEATNNGTVGELSKACEFSSQMSFVKSASVPTKRESREQKHRT